MAFIHGELLESLVYLTFSAHRAESSEDKLMMFVSFLSQKLGFVISCKLSPKETICMK